MIQKQKSQVRQYLSESFQHPNGSQLIPQSRPCGLQHSAPGFTSDYSNGTPTAISYTGLHGHSHPLYATHAGPPISPDIAPALSPALSSGATSVSEVSFQKVIATNAQLICQNSYEIT